MKRIVFMLIVGMIVLSACGAKATPIPTNTPLPTNTILPTKTVRPTSRPTITPYISSQDLGNKAESLCWESVTNQISIINVPDNISADVTINQISGSYSSINVIYSDKQSREKFASCTTQYKNGKLETPTVQVYRSSTTSVPQLSNNSSEAITEKSDGTFLVDSEIAAGKWRAGKSCTNVTGEANKEDGSYSDSATGAGAILRVKSTDYSVTFFSYPNCVWTYLEK